MADQSLEDSLRIARLDCDIEALAEPIRAGAWFDPREAAKLSMRLEEQVAAEGARQVLARLEELAIDPLLEGAKPELPEQDLWVAQTLVESQILVRRRIAELSRLLGDGRPVPFPSDRGLKEETVPPPRRVCDEAYLVLRRLVNWSEDEDDYLLNSDAFLHLTDQQRNEEIVNARQRNVWSTWVEAEV